MRRGGVEPGSNVSGTKILTTCFDNAFLQKSCLFVELVCFFSLLLRVAVFLNATRSDRSVQRLPLRKKVDQCNSLRRKKGVHDRRGNFL